MMKFCVVIMPRKIMLLRDYAVNSLSIDEPFFQSQLMVDAGFAAA